MINKVPAFWLGFALCIGGIIAAYFIFTTVFFEGYEDADMMLFLFIVVVPVFVMSRWLGRVIATSKVEVVLDKDILTVIWLKGVWSRSRPATNYKIPDLKNYVCSFNGTAYAAIDFEPKYKWGLKLQRNVFPFRPTENFEAMIIDIIKAVKPMGEGVDADFYQSVAEDVNIREAMHTNEPITICKATKVHVWSRSIGIITVLVGYLAIALALISIGEGGVVLGIVVFGVLILPIIIYLVIKVTRIDLELTIYTDKVQITQSKSMFLDAREDTYNYKEINELTIWAADYKAGNIIVKTTTGQYSLSEVKDNLTTYKYRKRYAAEYLNAVYHQYISNHNAQGHIKMIFVNKVAGEIMGGIDAGSGDLLGIIVGGITGA